MKDCAWAIERGDEYTTCHGWHGCERHACVRKKHAAQRRKTELAQYRKFPGNDVQQARRERLEVAVAPLGEAPTWKLEDNSIYEEWSAARDKIAAPLRLAAGHCSWCEGVILKGDTVNKRRGWHDGRSDEPDCLGEFYCHTRAPEQLAYILKRDGPKCTGCHEVKGRWGQSYGMPCDPDRLRAWGPSWSRLYPADIYVGETCWIHWSSALQVDHRLCLAVVVITIPEPDRWRYWGPENLQGLCHECHVKKTKADVQSLLYARRRLAFSRLCGDLSA